MTMTFSAIQDADSRHKLPSSRTSRSGALFRSSGYVLISMTMNALTGFVFWFLAARFYTQIDVGNASALLSYISLVALVSRFGLDHALIRFLPTRGERRVVSTSITLTLLSALAVAVTLVPIVHILIPSVVNEPSSYIMTGLVVVLGSMMTITGTVLLSMRRSRSYFVQNLFMAIRVPMIVLLVGSGVWGIIGSFGISLSIALVYSVIILVPFGVVSFRIDFSYVREAMRYAMANHVNSLLVLVPSMMIPALIVYSSGPEETATFYLAFSIASFVFMIPTAFGTALFVEGSHGEPLGANARASLLAMLALLLPVVLTISVFATSLLGVIGASYVSGAWTLRILALSSLPVAVCSAYFSVLRVQLRNKALLLNGFVLFATVIGLGYILSVSMGHLGFGVSWFLGYLLCSILAFLDMVWRGKLVSRIRPRGPRAEVDRPWPQSESDSPRFDF